MGYIVIPGVLTRPGSQITVTRYSSKKKKQGDGRRTNPMRKRKSPTQATAAIVDQRQSKRFNPITTHQAAQLEYLFRFATVIDGYPTDGGNDPSCVGDGFSGQSNGIAAPV